ncbi:MAG: sugar phosphate isomerase/epimerase [candidate division KSB1 bacterium]|nr:sugar phosphate isomerase/epimerase [candidate division KSB1 bacterium]
MMIDQIAISGTEYPFHPIEELYQMAEHLGVKNLELWLPHNFQYEELPKIKDELHSRALRAICISTWTQLNLPGDVTERQILINQSLQAARFLGAPVVNTYFGAHPDRTPEQAIKAYKENIQPCLEAAEKNGIVIVLENEFDRTGIDITRKAEWVLELVQTVNSPYFRLNYDPCNFYFAGEEPYPFAFNLLQQYIAYIHLKDGMKYHPELYDYPGDGFLWRDQSGTYICTDLGKGAIPYSTILARLNQENYTGFFTLEPHVPPAKLRETFERSFQYLKEQLIF